MAQFGDMSSMMRTQVRKGFGPMPAFPPEEIPDGELEDLIAFLNRLQAGGP